MKKEEYQKRIIYLYGNKEPFTKVKNGVGYYGVLCYRQFDDKVQCHICGQWFRNLNLHIKPIHKIQPKDYKIQYGFYPNTRLCGERLRGLSRDRILQMVKDGIIDRQTNIDNLRKGREEYWKNRQHPKYSPTSFMQRKNELDICPAQLLREIRFTAKQLNRVPTRREIRSNYAINSAFGSYNNAIKIAGLTPNISRYTPKWNRKLLITILREFKQKYKREATRTDCDRKLLPSRSTFSRHFKSWSKAKRIAYLYNHGHN